MSTPDNPAVEPDAITDVPAAAPPPDEVIPDAIAAAPPEAATVPVEVTTVPDPLGNLKAAADRIANSVRDAANHLTQDIAGWSWDQAADDLIAEAHELAAKLEAKFARKETVEEPTPVVAQEPVPVTIVDPPAQPTPVDEPAA